MTTPIWEPSPEAVQRSQLTDFMRGFADYATLHRWSVASFRDFWSRFLAWSGLRYEGDPSVVCDGDEIETARFFPYVRLSYAENLLVGGDERPAIVAADERGQIVRLSRGDLRQRVLRAAGALRRLGLGPGDRVVGIARNDAETVVACLAATAVGAAWSSVALDLAPDLVLARFRQLEPAALFAHTRDFYQGQERDASELLARVRAELPSLRFAVALDDRTDALPGAYALSALDETGFEFPRFPFDHPLFVLFSSGTTGPPKCIVHGTGGTLLEHVKEHRLHGDVGPADRIHVSSTVGWMMWNWHLSALATGATIVLYDGSVSHPGLDALWRVIADEKVTLFSTSPAYLGFCRDGGVEPRAHDLSALRGMFSTGSILFDALYDWVFEHVKPLPLQSVSGGTDILGCFVLGNPNLPLYRGESMCLGLGLDVRSLDGELVCATPFPSRPVGFLGDPDRAKFHAAYFAQHPGVWTHGDFISITERGTARILGRSDGVLNVRGLRIGPAELTSIVQDAPEIAEAMAIEQRAPDEPGGSRIVLLVVMRPGHELTRPLTLRLKKELKTRASAAHVPSVIAAVPALPVTFNGKRSERAATDAANRVPIKNLTGLKNPECLDDIRNHPALEVS